MPTWQVSCCQTGQGWCRDLGRLPGGGLKQCWLEDSRMVGGAACSVHRGSHQLSVAHAVRSEVSFDFI